MPAKSDNTPEHFSEKTDSPNPEPQIVRLWPAAELVDGAAHQPSPPPIWPRDKKGDLMEGF